MAKRQASRALPPPPTGQPKQTGNAGYAPPQTGGHDLGLNLTSHNGSSYPQPNSANQPDSSSSAPASSAVPGPEAYRPSLAGNELGSSVPILEDTPDEPPLPDYP